MLFVKDGQKLEVTDAAHIDCLKAKGWEIVPDEKKDEKTTPRVARGKSSVDKQ